MLAALKIVLRDRPYAVAAIIAVITQIVLTFHITYPGQIIFDEVHYVPAAQALIDLSAPRNTEHPLVGKELIALGMLLFGDNPIGWRLIPSLFATSTVVAGFAFLWLLIGRMRPAVIGALLILLNQHVFIMGRMAMLDVFLGAFLCWGMVALLWAMRGTPKQVRGRWILGAVLLGLAVGVKWAAAPYVAFAGLAFVVLRLAENPNGRWSTAAILFGRLAGTVTVLAVAGRQLFELFQGAPFPGPVKPFELWQGIWLGERIGSLAIIAGLAVAMGFWLRQAPGLRETLAQLRAVASAGEPSRRWPGLGTIPGLAILGSVSVLIYFLTFLPALFYSQNPLTLAGLIPFQRDMYALQTQILASHPYQSNWGSWPFMIRPIWAYYGHDDGVQRGVLLIGNPVVMWGGLLAVIACLVAWFRDRARRPLAMALLWIASLAIYIVIPKSLGFYYYYYLSSIFLCFAIAIAFDHFDQEKKRGREEWFAAVSLVAFCYFYPIISAWPLRSDQSFQNWMWLPSWP
jgi:dolichyl-phosphate-mannose--protein O-mannosyl transferase